MRAGLRDIEQAVKLLYSIQLTQEKTDYLFSLPLFYIITLKIRHPQVYSHFKNVWNRNAKSALNDEQHVKFIRDEFEYNMAFAGNTAYRIEESMHIICDPNTELTKVYPSHRLRSEPKKDLKDFIKDGMFEANLVRNFKMEKNFSTYIQIVEQAGQLL
ncbi:hypothetical protein [Pseudoalteromonas carrageenovora]|uniref:hypothetical protein n=1 Tax=Pseudoalteromonas carrageenovora TaxID=227 RepID=UPI0026E27E32|nr:hypothetical protein [Pseudoalteromonas carrageenovora]MDO6464783.1 hypothetical protein [Pseudoalteromonas carrageenovora]